MCKSANKPNKMQIWQPQQPKYEKLTLSYEIHDVNCKERLGWVRGLGLGLQPELATCECSHFNTHMPSTMILLHNFPPEVSKTQPVLFQLHVVQRPYGHMFHVFFFLAPIWPIQHAIIMILVFRFFWFISSLVAFFKQKFIYLISGSINKASASCLKFKWNVACLAIHQQKKNQKKFKQKGQQHWKEGRVQSKNGEGSLSGWAACGSRGLWVCAIWYLHWSPSNGIRTISRPDNKQNAKMCSDSVPTTH